MTIAVKIASLICTCLVASNKDSEDLLFLFEQHLSKLNYWFVKYFEDNVDPHGSAVYKLYSYTIMPQYNTKMTFIFRLLTGLSASIRFPLLHTANYTIMYLFILFIIRVSTFSDKFTGSSI